MRLLQHGDRGDGVKIVQQALADLGIFKASIGGNYLDLTEASVRQFQQIGRGPDGTPLEVTGHMDGNTWWALYHAGSGGKTQPGKQPGGMATLQHGDSGEAVKALQQRLKELGYFRGAVKGNFLDLTREAVLLFQMQHDASDGDPLATDGIVGPQTWWALYADPVIFKPSVSSDLIPKGLSPVRRKLLETALGEVGVVEQPMNSNRGRDVEKYQVYAYNKGKPWCAFFWSWVTKQAVGAFPYGRHQGAVRVVWSKAGSQQRAGLRGVPIPGDAYVMLSPDGTGHMGFVLRTSVATGRALEINTIEGNSSNQVRIVYRRPVDVSNFRGFIRLDDPVQSSAWERGGVTKTPAQVVAGGTR